MNKDVVIYKLKYQCSINNYWTLIMTHGLPRWLSGKESACQWRDVGLIPGSGRSPGGGDGKPLQYSCLGSPMERTWWSTVHGVTKGLDMTEWLGMHAHISRYRIQMFSEFNILTTYLYILVSHVLTLLCWSILIFNSYLPLPFQNISINKFQLQIGTKLTRIFFLFLF